MEKGNREGKKLAEEERKRKMKERVGGKMRKTGKR